MSESESTQKPDPTFLNEEYPDLRKPLGLTIEKRQQFLQGGPKGPRLSRKELETLLDGYYAIGDGAPHDELDSKNHAQIAGGRMVRNLALAASLALFLGFGLGLYGLSQQGGETRIGQQFNQTLANLFQMIRPSQGDQSNKSAVPKTAGKKITVAKPKPIKTASLVVANSSGAILAGIPLKLGLRTNTDTSLLQVKIMNVPADAVLTAGTRRKDGVWILQPGDLKNVSLVVSSDRKEPLRLEVELVETKTGELLSPTREIRVAILGPKRFKVRGL